ncbi:MAG: hypothetical protein FJ290_01720 [Planctomycetes bacterium]|nr:hypothetical protein [Planctomycetota bacterium]
MRRIACAIFPIALFLLASCELPEEEGGSRPPAARQPKGLEGRLAAREKGLDAARERLREVAKGVSPKAEDAPGEVKEFVGVDRMQAEVAKIRAAVAKVVVTEDDRAGLAAYCAGDFPRARKLFTASDALRRDREFPAWFLGAVALQEGEWPQARDWFTKAAARNRQCRGALLLRRLATLCQARGATTTAQLLLLFEQACRETRKELGIKPLAPSAADAFVPPLASDPVLFKAQELLADIARRHFWDVADALTEAATPEEKLGLVLLMGDSPLADTLIQGLAEEHRTDRDVQAFAFLHRHFARTRPPEVLAADLAGITALDKDNGALLLLRIAAPGPPLPRGEGRGEGASTGNVAPLSEADAALIAQAARAKDFRSYAAFRRPQRLAAYLTAFGGLLPYAPMTRVPSIYGHVAGVARRAAATVGILLEQGKTEEALKLAADTEAIAARAWDEAKSARAQLLQDAVVDALYAAVQARAEKAGQKPLVASCVERRAALCRHKADRLVAWDADLVTLFRMPIRRLAEAAIAAEESPALIHELAALRLKAEPDHYYKQAMDLLATVDDASVPETAYEQVVLLGRLRNPNAIPRLIALAGHTDPLLARLATKAFSAIAEGKE